jgi:hypothetical protein
MDPFLDNLIPMAVEWEEFQINEEDGGIGEKSFWEDISWEPQADTHCTAIRIQIRGVHSLSVANFQVFQGNDIGGSEARKSTSGKDYMFISNGPAQLKQSLVDMLTPEQRRKRALLQPTVRRDIQNLLHSPNNINDVLRRHRGALTGACLFA